MVAFRTGAVLGPGALELEGMIEFGLELLDEDGNWSSGLVGFGVAFEDAEGPEMLAKDDKLADMLSVAGLEFDLPGLDADGSVALANPEVTPGETAGPVLLVALDEGPATELGISEVALDDELELIDWDEGDEVAVELARVVVKLVGTTLLELID